LKKYDQMQRLSELLIDCILNYVDINTLIKHVIHKVNCYIERSYLIYFVSAGNKNWHLMSESDN